jgi:hypothetical protein
LHAHGPLLQAWEIKFQEPKRYWGNVPDDVLPRLHFYNVPVSGGEELASNPLNIIRSKYQPGDYVVSRPRAWTGGEALSSALPATAGAPPFS